LRDSTSGRVRNLAFSGTRRHDDGEIQDWHASAALRGTQARIALYEREQVTDCLTRFVDAGSLPQLERRYGRRAA
jgi:hypothetical protein